MSIQSKARRDARKRQTERERNRADAKASPVEAHAELRDGHRTLLAGVVRRDGEWHLGMDGRMAGSTDSAARVLALIRRAAKLHEVQGVPVRLVYSDALRAAAEAEVAAQGQTMEAFERGLAAEMEGRAMDASSEGGTQP